MASQADRWLVVDERTNVLGKKRHNLPSIACVDHATQYGNMRIPSSGQEKIRREAYLKKLIMW